MSGTIYRFKSLKNNATKTQNKPISGIDIFTFTKPSQRLKALKKYEKALKNNKNVVITGTDIVNYLLYVGIDYKGQLQMAYEAHGGGVSADVSINPFALVGLNTSIGVGASFKAAKQRCVIVSRGPSAVSVSHLNNRRALPQGAFTNELDGSLNTSQKPVIKPITINSIIGGYKEMKVSLAIDVSAGYAIGVGCGYKKVEAHGDKKGSEETQYDPETGINGNTGEKRGRITNIEAAGAHFSAKFGFEAQAGYTYDWFYGEDLYPLFFSDPSEARKKLKLILQEGSTKTMFKYDACKYMNDNKQYFGNKTINLHRSILWRTTTKGHARIIQRLSNVSSSAPPEIKRNANLFLHKLKRFDEIGNGTYFLALSSHKADGKAGVYARTGANINACGLASAGVNIGVFAGVSGSKKTASARFQTGVPAFYRTRLSKILTTHDTKIVYSSFFLGGKIDVDASFNVAGRGYSLAEDTSLGDTLEKASKKIQYRPKRLNQISYRTAIASWVKPPAPKNAVIGKKYRSRIDALPGTGVAVGQTYTIASLKKIILEFFDKKSKDWNWDLEPRNDESIIAISYTLNLKTVDPLLAFLKDKNVMDMVLRSQFPATGVLLEATFRTSSVRKLHIVQEIKATKNKKTKKTTNVYCVQLAKDFGKKLFEMESKTLESIRLRYRRKDLSNKDKTQFTLGFKVLDTGAKIKLERVSRAGTDGIVDVATVFINNTLKGLHNTDPANAYERAVPPAALFCQ